MSVDLGQLVTPRLSAYVPHVPTDQQVAGLVAHRFLPGDEPSEVFHGGAAGGGKTDWLLMGALEWVDVRGTRRCSSVVRSPSWRCRGR